LNGVLDRTGAICRGGDGQVVWPIESDGQPGDLSNRFAQEGHAPAGHISATWNCRISVFSDNPRGKNRHPPFRSRNRSFDLQALGFDEKILKSYLKLLARPSGLLLLTGPTGSGKTTTIYASLYHIVQRSGPSIQHKHGRGSGGVQLPMVSQAQISPVHEFTYPRALRSLMRQDPQVIMIGEIRDPETANIAVQAGFDRAFGHQHHSQWGGGRRLRAID
jgi:general secretion pathway protein E